MRKLVALCLFLGLLFSSCAAPSATADEALQSAEESELTSARELFDFFESGGSSVRLGADIDIEDAMLKLTSSRTPVEIIGNGHTISGSAPCVIRLEDGCSITLNGVTIVGQQTGIGLLGNGTVAAVDADVSAQVNAIQAAGTLTVASASSLTLSGGEGGIVALGVCLQQDSVLSVTASSAAISTGRGDLMLYPRVRVSCEASGSNAVETGGTLILMEESVLTANNTGEHNGVRAGYLQASKGATLNAKGGINGAGLFVVELYEDITLKGASTPDVKIEAGKGKLTFEAQ